MPKTAQHSDIRSY